MNHGLLLVSLSTDHEREERERFSSVGQNAVFAVVLFVVTLSYQTMSRPVRPHTSGVVWYLVKGRHISLFHKGSVR
jgi:hypothetical protein